MSTQARRAQPPAGPTDSGSGKKTPIPTRVPLVDTSHPTMVPSPQIGEAAEDAAKDIGIMSRADASGRRALGTFALDPHTPPGSRVVSGGDGSGGARLDGTCEVYSRGDISALDLPDDALRPLEGTHDPVGIGARASQDKLVGKHVGNYHILEHLGDGAMGTVYEAEDTQHPGRVVAIKLMHPYRVTVPAQRMVLSEGQIALQIIHPNVARVYYIGLHDDGRLYIAMEYVPGKDLEALFLEGKLTLPEKLSILVQICDGLEAIHRRNVVHRDLKPGNILVAFERAGLVVKIVDMGIAKIRDPSDPMAGPSTTIIGTFKGSPAYAAPEVVNHDGIGQGPDHRADIYSLGVILYYLVCRQLPFTVDMNMERAIDALLVKVGAGRFTQPIKVDSSIPESLNDIIVRTMSKDPDDRYQTVGELRQALLDFAAAQGISIHRRVEDSATSRADQVAAPVIVAVPVPDESIVAPMQRVRRWPRAAIAVAAASLALGAVGVGAWKFARREPLAEEVVNEAPYTVRITTDPPGALVEMEEINRHGERWRSPLGSAPTTIQEIGNKTIVVRHDGYFSAYLQTSPENNTFKIALEPLPK